MYQVKFGIHKTRASELQPILKKNNGNLDSRSIHSNIDNLLMHTASFRTLDEANSFVYNCYMSFGVYFMIDFEQR